MGVVSSIKYVLLKHRVSWVNIWRGFSSLTRGHLTCYSEVQADCMTHIRSLKHRYSTLYTKSPRVAMLLKEVSGQLFIFLILCSVAISSASPIVLGSLSNSVLFPVIIPLLGVVLLLHISLRATLTLVPILSARTLNLRPTQRDRIRNRVRKLQIGLALPVLVPILSPGLLHSDRVAYGCNHRSGRSQRGPECVHYLTTGGYGVRSRSSGDQSGIVSWDAITYS